jgi:hypothetical protein
VPENKSVRSYSPWVRKNIKKTRRRVKENNKDCSLMVISLYLQKGTPPLTVGLIKKIMWEEVRQKMRRALFFESYGHNLVRGTDDQKEAVKTFMEKREPRFKG